MRSAAVRRAGQPAAASDAGSSSCLPIIGVAIEGATQLRERQVDRGPGIADCGEIGLNHPALQHAEICGARDLVHATTDPVELADNCAKRGMLLERMLHR